MKKKISLIICIVFVLLVTYFGYKGFNLYYYNTNSITSEDFKNYVSQYKISNTITVKHKDIKSKDYFEYQNIKIRNDFKDYDRKDLDYNPAVKVVEYSKLKNDKYEGLIRFVIMPQFIDIFAGELSFYSSYYTMDDLRGTFKGDFNSADRKYFLLKNDINNDLDFFEYVRNNYYKENNIFMDKRTLMENYSFNMFTAMVTPTAESFTVISGDYDGYIFNGNGYKQIVILRNNEQYCFFIMGEELLDEEYIIDLFSTLEIR